MFRVILAVSLMLATGHWVYAVVQMAGSSDDVMKFHNLAEQASLTGWVMGALMLGLFIDYSIGEKND